MSLSNGSSSKPTSNVANEENLIDRIKKMSLLNDTPSKSTSDEVNEETLIIFDLDKTLSDHDYPTRCALTAVQEQHPDFKDVSAQKLIDTYNKSLDEAYNKWLHGKIGYYEKDVEKFKLLYKYLGMPEPTDDDMESFKNIYKPTHRSCRRATPGSIETLVKLRDLGYRIGIITNGPTNGQIRKIKGIGAYDLVERIITSEEVGVSKPSTEIFRYAARHFGIYPENTYMIGDSIDCDIQGAINSGLKQAVLYSPSSENSSQEISGRDIPVINHMSKLLGLLGHD
ncbi:HAD-like domain-containing protein [Fusarium flagelliforme]|uniref:HAD-like domain-containing protein n=1 Tax=Fusarium flagelliforme TaxID=2675880 RepID=UPI001E8CC7A5|nr:HAD-like domain-containing protein [Fusarium flagelliforme]KAH7183205.1 HAD-like domain-containing protein [Fusarium flagelliforme]